MDRGRRGVGHGGRRRWVLTGRAVGRALIWPHDLYSPGGSHRQAPLLPLAVALRAAPLGFDLGCPENPPAPPLDPAQPFLGLDPPGIPRRPARLCADLYACKLPARADRVECGCDGARRDELDGPRGRRRMGCAERAGRRGDGSSRCQCGRVGAMSTPLGFPLTKRRPAFSPWLLPSS